MANGWIALHRSLLDHWLWKDKPFSNGQAWIDLILLANHKDVKEYVNGSLKTFKKGTVNRSIESISHRWGWNRKKTRKFLNALEVDGMVSVNVTTHGTTISLINYDIYQTVGKTNGTAIDQTEGQQRENNVPQTTMNNNDNNDNNIREGKSRAFTAPSIEEISIYCRERNNGVDPQTFYDFYQSKGWMVGKNKMKDWKAAVRTWEKREKEKPQPKNAALNYEQRKYTEEDIAAIERKKLGIG